jgi:hypothetical protein
MENELSLLKSDFSTLLDIFMKSRKQIIVSLPNISIELAEAFVSIREKGIDVNVFIEVNEKVYRDGFGDYQALKILKNGNVKFYRKEKFNINCFIIDDEGFFYFPKSRFHEEEGIAYDLYPMTINQIKHIRFLFNLYDNQEDLERIFDRMDIEQVKSIASNIKPVEVESIKEIENKLSNDPPLKPIYARTLEVYKAKYQYVDLRFTGANLHTAKVKLPNKALPFRDENLKRAIEANLKLFTDTHNKEFFNDFFILKEKVNQMRDRYLVYIKFRDKNIINRDMKTAFENEIKVFNHLIENSKKNILNKLQGEIQETRKKIENDLYKFFIVNPSEEFSGLQGDVLDYELRNLVYSIVKNIKFPTAKELLDELKLHYFYSDITWEDLNKNEFIKELEEKKLLSIKEKAYFDSLAMEATEDF